MMDGLNVSTQRGSLSSLEMFFTTQPWDRINEPLDPINGRSEEGRNSTSPPACAKADSSAQRSPPHPPPPHPLAPPKMPETSAVLIYRHIQAWDGNDSRLVFFKGPRGWGGLVSSPPQWGPAGQAAPITPTSPRAHECRTDAGIPLAFECKCHPF